mmetsp:Transcript_14192/g.33895  ORF Transcript_14192/g.33895 Transcript_14192/m.33895 type:complete len:226 (-) Transcript_14192:359-1036(-)
MAGLGGGHICCLLADDFLAPPTTPLAPAAAATFFCAGTSLRFLTPPFLEGDLPRSPPRPRFLSFLPVWRSPSSSELESSTAPFFRSSLPSSSEDEEEESSSEESSELSSESLSESPLLLELPSLSLDDPDEDDEDDSDESSLPSEDDESLSPPSDEPSSPPDLDPRRFSLDWAARRRCCSRRFRASSFLRLRSFSFCSSLTSVPESASDCLRASRRELMVCPAYY